MSLSCVEASPAVPSFPTAKQQRVAVLDVLRGFSILSIAFTNVLFFALPISRLADWRWHQDAVPEGVTLAVVVFFIEGHFFPIFAMLFGMGMAMQCSRYQQSTRSFSRRYYRRLLVLLVIGIAHGILLWYGDILAMYALVGFIAFWLRNRSPRTLLISAVAVFMIPVLVQVPRVALDPCAARKSPDEFRNELVTKVRRQAVTLDRATPAMPGSPATTPGNAGGDPNDPRLKQRMARAETLVGWINFLADDQQVYRSGTIRQMILHRSIYFLVFGPLKALSQLGWQALGSMLLGIYLFRRGLFCGTSCPLSMYRRLVITAMVAGLGLETTNLIVHALGASTRWTSVSLFVCHYLGSTAMGLGYMGIMLLLYQQPRWQNRLGPLAAAGRMSLTNYLGSSCLFGLIFYGYGLGLMGRVGAVWAVLIALFVVIFLALFSVLWLAAFQYGPLEWVWRNLTYLRIFPIRRCSQAGTLHDAPATTPAD